MRTRTQQIKFFLDENEEKILEQKSKIFKNKSEFLRKIILETDAENLQDKVELLREIKIEIRRIGNNLNQIARHLNTEKQMEIKFIEEEFNNIWQLLKRVKAGQALPKV